MKRLLPIFLTVLLSACGDSSGPSRIALAGSWQGTFTSGGVSGQLTMTLQETSGTVSGNGTLTGGGTATALTVDGTYSPPGASLALHATGFEDINLSGTVSDHSLTGILNGSGFVGVSITMARQ